MAYNGHKIVHLLKERGIKAKVFFEYVYPGRSGNSSFHDIERNDNPSAKAIERIADLLDCSIDELFERDPHYTTNTVTGDNNTVGSYNVSGDPETLAAINNHLRDVIERQDKTIAELNRRIDQLIELAKRP